MKHFTQNVEELAHITLHTQSNIQQELLTKALSCESFDGHIAVHARLCHISLGSFPPFLWTNKLLAAE